MPFRMTTGGEAFFSAGRAENVVFAGLTQVIVTAAEVEFVNCKGGHLEINGGTVTIDDWQSMDELTYTAAEFDTLAVDNISVSAMVLTGHTPNPPAVRMSNVQYRGIAATGPFDQLALLGLAPSYFDDPLGILLTDIAGAKLAGQVRGGSTADVFNGHVVELDGCSDIDLDLVVRDIGSGFDGIHLADCDRIHVRGMIRDPDSDGASGVDVAADCTDIHVTAPIHGLTTPISNAAGLETTTYARTSLEDPDDGDLLFWDEANSMWRPGPDTGGGGSPGGSSPGGCFCDLADLGDVNLAGLEDGDVLVWDAGDMEWVPAPMGSGGGAASDFGDLLTDPKGSTDTPDDLFPGTSLDAKWTVVLGTAGTVSFLNTDDNRDIYQVDNGKLRFQPGAADEISLRQDYTLPDGASIVAAIEIPNPALGGDNAAIRLSLNDSDTSPLAGNDIAVIMEQDTTEWIFQADLSGSISELVSGTHTAALAYFRISRAGLVYRTFVSVNRGRSWAFVGGLTAGGAFTNIWLHVLGPSALPTAGVNPIFTWYWVQQGSNDLDPW